MFRHRLSLDEHGSEVGEAEHAVQIRPDEIVSARGKTKSCVLLELVPVDEDDSSYDRLLKVEAAE